MKTTRDSYLYFVRIPLLLVIFLLVGMGIFARRGWLDLRRMMAQTDELRVQHNVAQLQREELERQSEAFRADANEQERVVRQSLGYIKKNETVVEFY